jgi:glycosyltransferase involved in cell wall biosynthesis
MVESARGRPRRVTELADHQVTIAVPAFNEGRRLPAFVAELVRAGAAVASPACEIIVVDDGSAPEHLEAHRRAVEEGAAALARARAPHRLRLLALGRNGGKGAAIRGGWRDAAPTARWLGFVDADGAVPAREVWRLVALLGREGAPALLAGARIRMAGHAVERSLVRHLQGRVFATLAEQLLPNGFYDTQCGLKFVAADLARPRLAAWREARWLFDLELISAVRAAGGRCVEEPIDWSDPGGSKVVPLVDPLRMAWGLWGLRRRLARAARHV